MKKLFLTVLVASGLFAASHSHAATTNLLNLTQVNGTNNGNVFYVQGVFIPNQRFIFQNLGITNAASGSYTTNGITNAITINVQFSVDASNTNWITLATYTPSSTNASVDTYTPSFSSVTLPMRCQVITTNSLGVSTFNQQ